MMVNYKFNEDNLIADLKEYVDSTYSGHYSKGKFQATEFIIDSGHGMGFCIGNILKYAQRYGNKDGYNRKDLMKVLHYALIALHVHDEEQNLNIPSRSYDDFDEYLANNPLTIQVDEDVTYNPDTINLTGTTMDDNMSYSFYNNGETK
jgi:hypothetical protein